MKSTCKTCKWWQWWWHIKLRKGETRPCFNRKSPYYPNIKTKATDTCPYFELTDDQEMGRMKEKTRFILQLLSALFSVVTVIVLLIIIKSF